MTPTDPTDPYALDEAVARHYAQLLGDRLPPPTVRQPDYTWPLHKRYLAECYAEPRARGALMHPVPTFEHWLKVRGFSTSVRPPWLPTPEALASE